jgi:hypothetical protein
MAVQRRTNPVRASGFIRKMRGGSQPHLLGAEDGYSYVVKLQDNPQGTKVLVNELICSEILKHLEITSPGHKVVELTDQFLNTHSADIHFQTTKGPVLVKPGMHFGSRYVVNTDNTALFDWVPECMLNRLRNAEAFLGVLAFDRWVGNLDQRQCVFVTGSIHSRSGRPTPPIRPARGLSAIMIDNGHAFAGADWTFTDSRILGLYPQAAIYTSVRSLNDFEPWLTRIEQFPEKKLACIVSAIPLEWIGNERPAVERLMEQLIRRKDRIQGIMMTCITGYRHLFPNWGMPGRS